MFDLINRLKTPIESLNTFYKKVEDYYSEIDNDIPKELRDRLYYNIAYKIHNEYRCRRQKYLKSFKRYSKLKIEDLEHDYNKWFFIDYIRKELPNNYIDICSKLFRIDIEEFSHYEKRRIEFEDMF